MNLKRADRSGLSPVEFCSRAGHASLSTQDKVAAGPRGAALGISDQYTLPRGINLRNTGTCFERVSMRDRHERCGIGALDGLIFRVAAPGGGLGLNWSPGLGISPYNGRHETT